MPLPKQGKKMVIVAIPLLKMGGKKNWNGIVFFLSIVAMSLPKMGGKKKVIAEIWGGI